MLAGPTTRLLAWIVDLTVIGAAISLITPLFRILHLVSADIASAFSILAYFIISIGHSLFTEWSNSPRQV